MAGYAPVFDITTCAASLENTVLYNNNIREGDH